MKKIIIFYIFIQSFLYSQEDSKACIDTLYIKNLEKKYGNLSYLNLSLDNHTLIFLGFSHTLTSNTVAHRLCLRAYIEHSLYFIKKLDLFAFKDEKTIHRLYECQENIFYLFSHAFHKRIQPLVGKQRKCIELLSICYQHLWWRDKNN